MPPLQSHFDPFELMGLPMPFVDPFRQDLKEFEALSSLTSLPMPIHPRAVMTAHSLCQDQESMVPSPQRVMKGAATAPELTDADADAELREAVSGSGRVRLTPALAIHIFNQGKTKTKHSAALLSVEFGVSAKAIRDIWTKRSWVQETRPHWTLDDEQSFESPWVAMIHHGGDGTAEDGETWWWVLVSLFPEIM